MLGRSFDNTDASLHEINVHALFDEQRLDNGQMTL